MAKIEQSPPLDVPDSKTTIDDILRILNPVGRYQMFILFLYTYINCSLIINSLFMGFAGTIPSWTCSDPWLNDTSATRDCQIYERCSQENLTFVSEFYSIAQQWSLVCDKEFYVNIITSSQMLGLLIGAVMGGYISDLYGRKWTLLVMLCLQAVLGSLSAVSPNVLALIAFRFLLGLINAPGIAWVFTAETTINRYRLLFRILAAVSCSMWNQVLIAYLTKNWKWYTVVGNLEGLPALVILALATYESPRWLAQKGRREEAVRILNHISRVNKRTDALPSNLELESVQVKQYHVLDLFRTTRLSTYTFLCILNYFSLSLTYFGMYFNMANISHNVYMNTCILALVFMFEIPVAVLDMCHGMNRKYLMIIFYVLAIVCNLVIVIQIYLSESIGDITLIVASCIGQVSIGCAFDLCSVFAIELFPTLLRTQANGVMNIGARIGGIIAPQLLSIKQPYPYVCFAVVAMVALGADMAFLPDTKKLQLPETYEQANRPRKVTIKE